MSADNTITLGNVWAKFNGPNLTQARDILAYKQKGYNFIRAFKLGLWDGRTHLMKPGGQFPAGLSSYLIQELKRQGLEGTTVDQREKPKPIPELLGLKTNIQLEPHQQQAVTSGLLNTIGITKHPTAAGKTVVMSELVRQIACTGLVLVHRKDLLHQTRREFAEMWNHSRSLITPDYIGIIGDGHWDTRDITVATFQTLTRSLKEQPEETARFLASIKQVHVDEVHHLPAKTFADIMS
ncbi:hypothetical protein LCGC14_1973720, partial [marine sediment metagenome]